ncbi:TPA: oxidoreductase [Streptococcus suis]
MSNKKVILLTGASSGIGKVTAEYLAKEGHILYTGARRVEQMESLKAFGVTPLKLNVTDEESIVSAVAQVIRKEGRIDVLINNAGYGSYGAIEDVTTEEAKAQFEVNLFGLARLTREVLPHMRKQKSGRIINVTSMGGRLVTYLGAWYHATKFAVEAFSDALRMEVKEFGIDVSIIEPGGIKTEFGDVAANKIEAVSKGGAYEKQSQAVAANMRVQYSGNQLSDPIVVSKAISKAVNSRRPRARYLIGYMAKPSVFLRTVLPARVFDNMIVRMVRGY